VTFHNRADAGRQLGDALLQQHLTQPLVLALPRGGVEVGYEIARALRAPLDVIPARKLGAPIQPELAIGAIAPGAAVLNRQVIEQLGISEEEIRFVLAGEEQEMTRRAQLFRAGRPPLDVSGKDVVIADDGLATGATAAAAIESVRHGSPRSVTLAVPVGARETVEALRDRVDHLVVLEIPTDFRAVGQWYEDFDQTSDAQVIDLLRRAAVKEEP
jgi:predicted phosphoribosyltransferase